MSRRWVGRSRASPPVTVGVQSILMSRAVGGLVSSSSGVDEIARDLGGLGVGRRFVRVDRT